MYKITDKILKILIRDYVVRFGQIKRQLFKFDKLNVLQTTNDLYAKMDAVTRKKLLELANLVYLNNLQKTMKKEELDEEWLFFYLEEYNPITKYVYTREWDRKRARFFEALVSSKNKESEIDPATRAVLRQVKMYADHITRQAVLKAFKDSGVEYVRWITVEDERRCKECRDLHNKVFRIDKVPDIPHIGCRCHLEAVTGKS